MPETVPHRESTGDALGPAGGGSMRTCLLLFLLQLACSGSPEPLSVAIPEETAAAAHAPARQGPVSLGDTTGVAAADLNGDGVDELVVFDAPLASWKGSSLGGRFQRAARGDIDGDGDEEAVVATGQGRGVQEDAARVWALHDDRAQLLWEQAGPRNQVTTLQVRDGRVFVAAFSDTRRVVGGFLDDGALIPAADAHMGMQMLPWAGGVAVGRLYGDAPRSNGDLSWVKEGKAAPLPSLRGVRTMATGDLDGDGAAELLVGDGWHVAYGERAVARVRLLRDPGDLGRTIAFLDGSYAVTDLEVIGRGAEARILAGGTEGVYLLTRDGLGWRSDRLADGSETGNAVFVKTHTGPAVAISGPSGVLQALSPAGGSGGQGDSSPR